ncbi:MAG: hydrogenase maturation protease [Ancalomicrobiaceae bacterium]|nr:hydrogenase maturation protease [Ancalomicrobiaceae bacterium]
MQSALVIGYGNTLRSDDGAGPKVAEVLAEAGTAVLLRHQLVPELADELKHCTIVVFVDAVATLTPGAVAIRQIAAEAAADGSDASGLTHHCSPETLLLLADRLYGARPRAYLVTLGAASFELGDELSSAVAAAVPVAAAAVRQLIEAPG